MQLLRSVFLCFHGQTLQFANISILGGHLDPSNFKDVSKEIGHIYDSLEHVADYNIRPMPKIAMQAVKVVFWVSLAIATLDNSWKNINNFSNHTNIVWLGILVSMHLFGCGRSNWK